MTSVAALVEPHIDELEVGIRTALDASHAADADEAKASETFTKASETFTKAETILGTSRTEALQRRIEVGRLLVIARTAYPAKGPRSKGWGDLLERVGLTQSTAWRYMEFAGATAEQSCTDGNVHDSPKSYADAGIDKRPRASDATDNRPAYGGDRQRTYVSPDDGDAPDDRDAASDNVIPLELDDPQEKAPDRNTWCTPKWIADAIGEVDLDPCSNDRSHIHAKETYVLERGENGLMLAPDVPRESLCYINPPYGRGLVIQWVRAYGEKRFIFLLKFDPSTLWFAELMSHTKLVLFPKQERVEFEPPPDVKASSVQFPHALFFSNPEDARLEILNRCYDWEV